MTPDEFHIVHVDKLDEIEVSSHATPELIDTVDELVEESNEVDSDSSDGDESPIEGHATPCRRSRTSLSSSQPSAYPLLVYG